MDIDFEGDPFHISNSGPLPLRIRWSFYLGTWVATYLATRIVLIRFGGYQLTEDALIGPLIFAWSLPLGIPALLTRTPVGNAANLPWLLPMWAGYLVHAFLTLKSRRRLRFFLLLGILAIFLALNLVACEYAPSIRI